MPGPNSAPNGDRRLTAPRNGSPITLREKLRASNKLVTGKTAKKRK